MELHIVRMAEAEKDPGVIIVPDNNDIDHGWPDTGPQIVEEAKAYTDKIINAFDTFGGPDPPRQQGCIAPK